MTIRIDLGYAWAGTLPSPADLIIAPLIKPPAPLNKSQIRRKLIKDLRAFPLVDVWANINPLTMVLVSSFFVDNTMTDEDLYKKYKDSKDATKKYLRKTGRKASSFRGLSLTNGRYRKLTLFAWLEAGEHFVNGQPAQSITVINIAESDGHVIKPSWAHRQRADDPVVNLSDLLFFHAGYTQDFELEDEAEEDDD